MRDHTKLAVFEKADRLLIEVYRVTGSFPRSEAFGLTAQMRRAAVSVPSNIVEGLRFIDMATGSAKELAYQLDVAKRLGFGATSLYAAASLCSETVRMLAGLQTSMRSE